MSETVNFKEYFMNNNWLARFWGVIIRPQTYLNMVYLFLAFPLGVIYFVFLVTGLAVGFPLIIIWVGLILLAVVFAASWALTLFERQMAIWLLKVDIGPTGDISNPEDDLWQRFKKYISNPVTWKGLLFLLLKFPLGVLSFSLGTTLVATSLAFVFSPIGLIFFPNAQVRFFEYLVHPAIAAVVFFLLGILLVPISLHILNGLAYVYGQIARVLLGKLEPAKAVVPAAPVAPAAPAAPAAPQTPPPAAEIVPEPAVTPEPPAVAEPAIEAVETASSEKTAAAETGSLTDLFPPEPEEPAAPVEPSQPS